MVLDGLTPAAGESPKGNDAPNQMLYLTEGEKNDVKAIQRKTGKTGYHVRIRWIYIMPKAKYSTTKALHTVYGAFKQYNSLGSNGFKNDSRYLCASIVFMKKTRLIWRRNRMMIRYKNRGHFFSPGEYGFILNSEELAGLWHFPTLGVKAPLVQRLESKRAEPPGTLPVVDSFGNAMTTAKTMPRKGPTPNNLPRTG